MADQPSDQVLGLTVDRSEVTAVAGFAAITYTVTVSLSHDPANVKLTPSLSRRTLDRTYVDFAAQEAGATVGGSMPVALAVTVTGTDAIRYAVGRPVPALYGTRGVLRGTATLADGTPATGVRLLFAACNLPWAPTPSAPCAPTPQAGSPWLKSHVAR